MAATEARNEGRAQARWVRHSARKARVVLDNVRGRTVPEARTILAFTPRAAARDVEKVLHSAVANAESQHGVSGDDLVVMAAYADEGPTLKRFRPRARGRASKIMKRTCHITVRVAEPPGLARPASPASSASAESAEKPKRTRARKAAGETPAAEKPKRTRRKKEEVAT
jgi:large subunit ribosomal protein L22